MAPTQLGRPSTCLDCLRRLARSAPPFSSSSSTTIPTTLSLSPFLSPAQTRGAKTTKAEEEDLQGIPVRLLVNIPGFGRKHAIIRVKPGRMRNYWFPKYQAEYMTAQRFKEMGLTEAAIGVRDRTFGTKLVLDHGDNNNNNNKKAETDDPSSSREPKKPKKETMLLPPEESLSLLQALLPPTLTFARKVNTSVSLPSQPQPEPAPEPTTPRSPSLSANAAVSTSSSSSSSPPPTPVATVSQAAHVPIFGSVSTTDVLAAIRETLEAADPAHAGRLALEAEGVQILGLDEEGDDRIKRLGTFEVVLTVSAELEPVRREVSVVAEE